MENYDRYHPTEPNDYDSANGGSEFEKLKSRDRGRAFVFRKVERKDGQMKNKKIDIFTTSDHGCIRDAVSGNYYSEKAGTFAEYLFFKVSLSTGEFKTKNGSNTLFYLSPEEYEKHLHHTVSQNIKDDWLERKRNYIASCKSKKQ